MGDQPDIQGWLAHFDEANQLAQHQAAYAAGSSVVAQAIERLYAYEHAMTPPARQGARERLWLRDTPALPLPTERDWWAQCQCRVCTVARRLGRFRQRPTVHAVQRAVVRRQAHS